MMVIPSDHHLTQYCLQSLVIIAATAAHAARAARRCYTKSCCGCHIQLSCLQEAGSSAAAACEQALLAVMLKRHFRLLLGEAPVMTRNDAIFSSLFCSVLFCSVLFCSFLLGYLNFS